MQEPEEGVFNDKLQETDKTVRMIDDSYLKNCSADETLFSLVTFETIVIVTFDDVVNIVVIFSESVSPPDVVSL